MIRERSSDEHPGWDVDAEALAAMQRVLPSTTAAFRRKGYVRLDAEYGTHKSRFRRLLMLLAVLS